VIPADFDYAVAESVDEAISLLGQGGEDAKLLAGGHSLLPLMKLRFAAPSMLIDLRKLDDLKGIQSGNGDGVRIGPLTTHAMLQSSDLGLPATAAAQIADQQVRNRGTIGGSIGHGDPASDLPAVLLVMEGSVTARGPNGERSIPASELFQDFWTTALADDEVITDVRLPSMDGYGHAYLKFARRAEDWAMVGVAALVKVEGGSFSDVRIGLTNMGMTPLRATQVEEALKGQSVDADTIRSAAEAAAEGTDPPGDLNATPDYKRHLSRVLVRRAVEQAAGL
jgi:aerobic carbon-monoxide dehydrogenase medium subunit